MNGKTLLMTRPIFWLWPAVMILTLILAACDSTGEGVAATPSSTAPSPAPTAEAETDQPSAATSVVAASSTPIAEVELIYQGYDLYTANCAPCHQANGEGIYNTVPALNGNAFVLTEDPFPAVYTVLHGREEMPSFEGALTDRQIAAILSYVRNAWNNQAPLVSAEQIQGVQETADIEMAQVE